MLENRSPWLAQLKRVHPARPLECDHAADVAIVGGGIAGIVTAFFTLRDTNKSVVLLEADRIAHGATGHNAGQLTSYFERPLADIAEEFGVWMAADGQRSIESAWTLLDAIVAEARLQTPAYRFTGYAGLSTKEQVVRFLKDSAVRIAGGLPTETMLVADSWNEHADIPDVYKGLYTLAPQENILALLETGDTDYIACLSSEKGCMNSALFCEELIGYLAATYPERFSFFEKSPVGALKLEKESVTLTVGAHTARAARAVLCTNGFEGFTIENHEGEAIDRSFHQTIAGRIGYMAAHTETLDHPPVAISYFKKEDAAPNDPTGENYFYVTRRPHNAASGSTENLICVGGPDTPLPNDATYERSAPCREDFLHAMQIFISETYGGRDKEASAEIFYWHGLMGYTPTGLRRIGPEPKNPALLYNLGCNGVGILPSIFGAKKIAGYLSGITYEPSLFDPHGARWESDTL